MRVMGVDASTRKIAWAILEGGELWAEEFSVPGNLARHRFKGLVRYFDEALAGHPVDEIVIEDVPFVRNRAGTIDLAQIVGGLLAVCSLRGIRCRLVNNLTWKSKLGVGKRKNVKDSIRAFAVEHFSFPEDGSQDIADAICIAEYARRTHDQG